MQAGVPGGGERGRGSRLVVQGLALAGAVGMTQTGGAGLVPCCSSEPFCFGASTGSAARDPGRGTRQLAPIWGHERERQGG